ncbi:MAG: glycosyltransferase family 8 protein [Dysgonamonadaceae bacterium]|nr:glycosyltransferase family 8 protein [Dysgonamonadaceae bacterium]
METSKQNIIPVFFTFNNNYAFPAQVAIYSLLKYADKQYFYKLYILQDSLTIENQSRLLKIIKSFTNHASLEFINVGDFHQNSDWKHIKNKCHFSKEIFNKLIADIVFPQYDRIICSDVDVVFKGDISKSFYVNQDADYLVEGIRNVFKSAEKLWKNSNYTPTEKAILLKGIGAGYLILNIKQLRMGKGKEMRAYYKENLENLTLPEQDVINICCYPNIGYLPHSYMVSADWYSIKITRDIFFNDLNFNVESLFIESLKNPVQLHYAGYNKPWNSFFGKKWFEWFQEVNDAGLTGDYLQKLPCYLFQRRKQYNLLRFIGKMNKKFTKLCGK